MKTRNTKKLVTGSLLALTAVMLFSLLVGAGTEPTEPVIAAEGRQFAVMHIFGPEVPGPYLHSGPPGFLPPGGIKALHLESEIIAPPNSGDPCDPWSTKAAFSEIMLTKEFDQACPDLNFYCAAGTFALLEIWKIR